MVWGLAEPLDQRLFRSDQSDIALLGKALTAGPRWRAVGFAAHAVNGALFGLAFHEARRRISVDPGRLALAMALVEHVASWPLGRIADRYHPRLGSRGVPPLHGNDRAFGQATMRHALFGIVLGCLA
jgi:hypothetical protein